MWRGKADERNSWRGASYSMQMRFGHSAMLLSPLIEEIFYYKPANFILQGKEQKLVEKGRIMK